MRKRQAGLTLIEILLAIAVLVIGIVGLLPVFYAGLSKTKLSVQESASSVIVSSVIESIRQSMRLDTYTATERGSASGDNFVEYWHAGVKTDVFFKLPHTGDKRGATVTFQIEVPEMATTGGGAALGTPAPKVFTLGGPDPGGFPLNYEATDIEKDQLATYQFNFMIRPTSEPHIDNVYEFVVRVYRNFFEDSDVEKRNSLVQEVHFIVAGN